MSVLNQDTSRNFLNSSDPKDKYKVSHAVRASYIAKYGEL